MCEIKFDRNFSTQSPDEFLSNHIFINTALKSLYLGHDFAFGANKAGSQDLAMDYCKRNQVEFEILPKFEHKGERVSSSLVRKCIMNGEIDVANQFLGRKFFLNGKIIKGDGRGRTIGFPTANIHYSKNRVLPDLGVYVTMSEIDGMSYQSVTNIGKKPTFGEFDQVTIESHLLDFDRDIYGETLKVDFYKRIRPEKKFASVNELMSQIQKDVDATKNFFNG